LIIYEIILAAYVKLYPLRKKTRPKFYFLIEELTIVLCSAKEG